MSKRDWLSYAAIGGYIAFVCLGSYFSPQIAELFNSHSEMQAEGSGGQDSQIQELQAPIIQNNRASSPQYEPDCSERANADLCAQWRMAKAAEDQTSLNHYGFILLAATLFTTGLAAFFAGATWWTMLHTAEMQLRAYIGFGDPGFGNIENPTRIGIPTTNHGQTPAYEFRAVLNRHLVEPPGPLPDDFTFPDYNGEPVHPVGQSVICVSPGQCTPVTFAFGPAEAEKVRQEEASLFIYGRANYVTFGKERVSEFCFQYDVVRDETGAPIGHLLVLMSRHNRHT